MNKFILKSKTVIGAIIGAAPSLAVVTGITLTDDDTAMITTTVDAIIQLFGFAYAIYGRIVTKGEKLNV